MARMLDPPPGKVSKPGAGVSKPKKRVPPATELHQLPMAAILEALKGSVPAPLTPETPEPIEEYDPDITPMDYLLRVMRNPIEKKDRRDRAAALLLPFTHAKAGEAGKKEEKNKAAKTAASGKFSVPQPPLRAVK